MNVVGKKLKLRNDRNEEVSTKVLDKISLFYLLGSFVKPAFLLNLLLVTLQVLDHEIFASELEVIAVVIDALVWRQMVIVHDFVDCIALDPQYVPVLTVPRNQLD